MITMNAKKKRIKLRFYQVNYQRKKKRKDVVESIIENYDVTP